MAHDFFSLNPSSKHIKQRLPFAFIFDIQIKILE